MKGLSRRCIYIGPEHLLHTKTKGDASITEELIALTEAGRMKRKNLEWERSGSDGGPDVRKTGKGKGHNREIRRNRDRKARRG